MALQFRCVSSHEQSCISICAFGSASDAAWWNLQQCIEKACCKTDVTVAMLMCKKLPMYEKEQLKFCWSTFKFMEAPTQNFPVCCYSDGYLLMLRLFLTALIGSSTKFYNSISEHPS